MKRNKSSKTAFDLMRHYELKKFLEGMDNTLELVSGWEILKESVAMYMWVTRHT